MTYMVLSFHYLRYHYGMHTTPTYHTTLCAPQSAAGKLCCIDSTTVYSAGIAHEEGRLA
eukprot:COSAG06_NODE_31322_length_523_cov_1.127358_2_plen_58_part_01